MSRRTMAQVWILKIFFSQTQAFGQFKHVSNLKVLETKTAYLLHVYWKQINLKLSNSFLVKTIFKYYFIHM